MKHFNEFVLSIYSYSKAISVISKYHLYKYVFILVLLLLFFVVPVMLVGEATTFISSYIPFLDGEKYARIGSEFFSSISGFFVLLVLIPIFTLVSDEVNYQLRGVTNKFTITQFVSDIFRGIKITLRNLIYQYVSIVIVLILLSIFSSSILFSLFGKLTIFTITSYFYGFSLMDYAMENYQMNYKKSVQFTRSHIGLAIGLGAIYYMVISLNDLAIFKTILGNLSVYWSAFAEAIVAFIGVIAANIVLHIVKKKNLS